MFTVPQWNIANKPYRHQKPLPLSDSLNFSPKNAVCKIFILKACEYYPILIYGVHDTRLPQQKYKKIATITYVG
ncbi:MAG: hypothetical protein ACTTJW_08520, partial [Sphaerochaeta sp.]